MLVQFTVKNFLSFREETVFDMTAINAYKEHPGNLIDIGTKEKYIRVAAIYGANASGKTNLCAAMVYFLRIVAESFNNVSDDYSAAIEKYYDPFSFERHKGNSEFEVVEILGDYEYKYGFEYNANRIVTEWLYRKNLRTNRKVVIFERTTDKIEFGASVRKECDVYKEQLPVETLALSFFNKLKLQTDTFRYFYDCIMSTLIVPASIREDARLLEKYLPGLVDNDKPKLLEFLTAIDTGIKDIDYDETEKGIRFVTFHRGKDGREYPLNLYNESEGTLKSILLYIYVRKAIQSSRLILVDELNIKLHPLLLKFIIDLFYDNDSTAQLIYTTHDTTLMDKKFFRRDQIWFVQKDEFGYSELSALSDFKVRSDASFEKDYLAGVYGGIPYLGEFEMKEGE